MGHGIACDCRECLLDRAFNPDTDAWQRYLQGEPREHPHSPPLTELDAEIREYQTALGRES